MPDKNAVEVEGIDGGVEVSPSHTPETYALNAAARHELANWLPQWGKKPKADSQTQETAHRLHEENAKLVKPFALPDHFKNEKERIRNLTSTRSFLSKLENILGSNSTYVHTPPPISGFDNRKLKGLFVKMRGMDGFTYDLDLLPGWKKICAIQVPYMSEWGIFHTDAYGGIRGFKYIGWRGQVLLRLILADAITEEEAHKEFGTPFEDEHSKEYYFHLRSHRGKRPV